MQNYSLIQLVFYNQKSIEMESQNEYDVQSKDYEYNQEQEKDQKFVVPKDRTKLKACTKCNLLKTDQQWSEQKRCQNCGSFDDGDYKNNITDKCIVSIINPESSWIRKKLKLMAGKRIVAGAYAMNSN